ncbi:MAG: hypothetical protein CM15mP80_07810 [Alphaproteobacteria bacterium]|nr:MAG: hypothetical protein CM15mP80_07810 [Alphaproteobacteria bacterium]
MLFVINLLQLTTTIKNKTELNRFPASSRRRIPVAIIPDGLVISFAIFSTSSGSCGQTLAKAASGNTVRCEEFGSAAPMQSSYQDGLHAGQSPIYLAGKCSAGSA